MRHCSLFLVALGISSLAAAQTPMQAGSAADDPALADARAFRALSVPGRQVRPAVRKIVRELEWHKTLESAAAEAARTDKPIVWIQALGDLKGFT